MVDDYDYEYRRRRPRRTTYEGSYRRPGQSEYFDPSADILAGIESIEKSIGERKKKVTEFENTAALENQKYQDALADTESMEDTGVVDSLQQNLSDKILELNRLKIASFEGDQTEYLKKSSELNRYIETLPVLMGLIDEEAKATKDARLNGTFNKEYLRSNNKKYLDFIDAINDGGKGVTFDTKNGNIIANLNGKEVFNGNAYVKGKKEGFDLIKYADGYQEQIDQADAQAYKGLESLVSKDVIKGVEKGDKITGELAKNYAEARKKYKERLISGEVAIPINESTYQKYTKFGSQDPNILSLQWGEDIGTQSKLTKTAIIEKMVEDRFPGGDRVIIQTTQETKKKPTALELAKFNFEKMKFNVKQIQTAKTEDDLRKSVDFYLNRNLKHADKVSKLPKGSKERADMTAKLLNEAKGIEELGFKSVPGIINTEGVFEFDEDSGEFFIVDADNNLVDGIQDNVGLIDVLNKNTVYNNLTATQQGKIKPYVTDRVAGFSSIINDIENFVEKDNKNLTEEVEKVKSKTFNSTKIPVDAKRDLMKEALEKTKKQTNRKDLSNINMKDPDWGTYMKIFTELKNKYEKNPSNLL